MNIDGVFFSLENMDFILYDKESDIFNPWESFEFANGVVKLSGRMDFRRRSRTFESLDYKIRRELDGGDYRSGQFILNFSNARPNYIVNLSKETEWIYITVKCKSGEELKYSLSRNDRLYVGHDFGLDSSTPPLPQMYYFDDGKNQYHGRLKIGMRER